MKPLKKFVLNSIFLSSMLLGILIGCNSSSKKSGELLVSTPKTNSRDSTIILRFENGNVKEIIDLYGKNYFEFFSNGMLRCQGKFYFGKVTFVNQDGMSEEINNSVCPDSLWSFYDSHGNLTSKCLLSPERKINIDSCDVGNGLYEMFYCSDFTKKVCFPE